jgi:hypothetical protein
MNPITPGSRPGMACRGCTGILADREIELSWNQGYYQEKAMRAFETAKSGKRGGNPLN